MKWNECYLHDVCKPKQWPTIPKSKLLESGHPVFGANGVIGYFDQFNHESETILITCRGATCGSINICEKKSYVTGNAMALDELDESSVDMKFLAACLRASDFTTIITGVAQPQITRQSLSRLKIPLPPLDEQKRIAKILDAADALRAKRRQSIAELDTFLQSTFLDLFGDPVTNPKGWDEYVAGNVTDCIVPGRDKPKSFTGSTPWVTTDDLVHLGYTTESTKGYALSTEEIEGVKAKLIPPRSVIFSCVGDLGVTSINKAEMVVNQQLHTFQCSEGIIPEFLMYYLPFRKPWMFRRATQTTLPYLNKTNCNSIPVFVPPLELQQRFASIVESVEQQKSKMQAHLTELDTLFASLQQRAFKGDL